MEICDIDFEIWDEGTKAFFAGIDKTNNPYPENSDNHKDWLTGWTTMESMKKFWEEEGDY